MADLCELSEDTSQKARSLQKKDIDMMVRIPAKKKSFQIAGGILVGKVELSI